MLYIQKNQLETHISRLLIRELEIPLPICIRVPLIQY